MKNLVVLLSTMFVLMALTTTASGQIIVGNYTATSFQSGAALPSSCSGSAVFTLTTTWTPYYCDGGTYVAFGTGAAATTATSLANGGAGAEPYQTAASTTSFVYPATDTFWLYLDGNRTDSYTPDGTEERPFLTKDAALAYIASMSSICTSSAPCTYAIQESPALYTSTLAIATNQYQSIVFSCNGSTWIDSAGITFNSPVGLDHCSIGNATTPTTINFEHNYTTQRSKWVGGSSYGTINVGNATNTNVFAQFEGMTVGGITGGYGYSSFYIYGATVGVKIVGQITFTTRNATSIFSCDTCNITSSSSNYNVDTGTYGGQAIIIGGKYNTASYRPNFYFNNANTAATAHSVQGPVIVSGEGLQVGSSTYWCGSLFGGVIGTGITTGCNAASGRYVSPIYAGISTNFSCTPGAASGTGATCVCATNHVCTTGSGDLTLTTGTGTTTGTAVTVVLYGSAQASYPNCSSEVHTPAAISTVGYTLENSTGFTRYAFGAPAASTVYTIHYQCGY